MPPVIELILGGQKSGKSRAAERRALSWLFTTGHEAAWLATATPADDEMRERIARHQIDRTARVPRLRTVEASHDLAGDLRDGSEPHRLIIVDCLTLWLTQRSMPLSGTPASPQELRAAIDSLIRAAVAAPGPIVFVSNEIGLGVSPLTAEARSFVDALGLLHQQIGAVCHRVTLMVAGCELAIRSATT